MASDSVQSRRESQKLRRAWCCSFTSLPKSPENIKQNQPQQTHHKTQSLSSSYSFPNSPQINHKTNLTRVTRMDPRRILSPGRVSPIDSDPVITVTDPTEPAVTAEPVEPVLAQPVQEVAVKSDVYDVRLSLKGRNGECSVLEVDSEVLSACSSVFKRLIEECKKREGGDGGLCRIEVPDVQNLSVFHETIEIMFDEEDVCRRMRRMGVSRAIDVLEVAAGIMFTKGVLFCLKYIEAVPWSESEEDKLRSLFTKFTFDHATTRDVLARLSLPEQMNSQQHLASQLVRSVTTGSDNNSRSELKSLVKDLFAKSSVYEKDLSGLDKEALYVICQSCLDSLVALFEEASESVPEERSKKTGTTKPLIERISREADSINWLLGILLDQQMAEEFVDIWADQEDLLRMHEKASPMVRYELSRISAWVFIALGKGKLHCRSETRCRIFQSWFTPMLTDFGWLQRCKKGLDIKVLEEAMGQALLTLPMKNQHLLFMEWFRCFSRQGTECPNLGKAFQIWWRRSSKSSGTLSLDSR